MQQRLNEYVPILATTSTLTQEKRDGRKTVKASYLNSNPKRPQATFSKLVNNGMHFSSNLFFLFGEIQNLKLRAGKKIEQETIVTGEMNFCGLFSSFTFLKKSR